MMLFNHTIQIKTHKSLWMTFICLIFAKKKLFINNNNFLKKI